MLILHSEACRRCFRGFQFQKLLIAMADALVLKSAQMHQFTLALVQWGYARYSNRAVSEIL